MNRERWKQVLEINAGWSSDKKYHVFDDTRDYLLRISDASTFEEKKQEAQIINRFHDLHLPVPHVYEMSIIDDEVCMRMDWMKGESGNQAITKYALKEQYNLGTQAGNILRVMHSCKVDDDKDYAQEDKELTHRKLDAYLRMKSIFPKDQIILNYIKQNLYLLDTCQASILHGDYHLGNMVIDNGRLSIIDFNRWQMRDIYHEFAPMAVFSREVSPMFCQGQINGYFNGEVPEFFWKKLKLYLCIMNLYSICWAQPYGEDEVQGMIKRAHKFMQDYDDLNLDIPLWYVEEEFKTLGGNEK